MIGLLVDSIEADLIGSEVAGNRASGAALPGWHAGKVSNSIDNHLVQRHNSSGQKAKYVRPRSDQSRAKEWRPK
jgi:hypothetical protein